MALPPSVEAKMRQNTKDFRSSYFLIRKSIAEGNIQKAAYFYHDLWKKTNDRKIGVLFAFAHEMAIEPSPLTPFSSQQEKMMMSLQTRSLKEEADQCWRIGLATFPESAEVALFDAYRLSNHAETFRQAVAQGRKAVKLDPKWAYAYRILSISLLQLSGVEEDKSKKSVFLEKAYQAMVTAQHLDVKSINKMFAATIYERKGNYKTALVYLDGAIAEQGNPSQRQREIMQHLRKGLVDELNASKTLK